MQEYIKNIVLYLIIINIIGLLIMLIDKKKAINSKWRIPEKTIFIVTILGGGIGTIIGMYKFRHKTKKLKFTIGLPVITLSEIVLIIWIVSRNGVFWLNTWKVT